MIERCCVILALILLSSPASAADFGDCTGIEDATARLACYDAAARRAPTSAAEPSAAAAVPAPTQSTPVSPAEAFGMNDQLRREQSAAEAKQPAPESITALVSNVQRNSQGYFTITLDNGQRWYVSETSRVVSFKAGDQVSIRRATLGSYLVSGARGGTSLRTRRIE